MATTSKQKGPKDLRRLMKEQLNKTKKKIDSPLARYNNAGQLFCVLCDTILKSDLLWDAHIRGTKHKENLTALKSGQAKSQPASVVKKLVSQPGNDESSSEVIRTAQFKTPQYALSKRKNEQPLESLSKYDTTATKKPKVSIPSSNSSNSRLPNDFFDTSTTDQHTSTTDQHMSTDASPTSADAPQPEVLPSDFFDQPGGDIEEAEEPGPSTEKEPDKSIPEGFFDDPKLDAKARKVEFKDPAEEEWEKFQKALSTENQVSEAIIHEEEEESRIDRALDEISEQSLYYMRADALRDKQSAFKKNRSEKQKDDSKMSDDSDTDSDDLEEMFNWRAKKALS